MVDRTQNEWSDWQLKNLNAIVWLYRGEVDKYKALLTEYHAELADDRPFAEIQPHWNKTCRPSGKKPKPLWRQHPARSAKLRRKSSTRSWKPQREADRCQGGCLAHRKVWRGRLSGYPGLCKVASRDTILNEKGASLTPGAYVGVAPVEDDGVDFAQRMKEIHKELLELQAESNRLMETISKNLEEMGV